MLLQNGRVEKRRIKIDRRYAHDEYRSVLVDCRVGINQTAESIQAMNDLLVSLIKEKHQSIGHIYATHAEKLGCSRRTLYSYISNCVFEIRNSDLIHQAVIPLKSQMRRKQGKPAISVRKT